MHFGEKHMHFSILQHALLHPARDKIGIGRRGRVPVYRGGLTSIQYIFDKMGTHFDPNYKHFCSDSHFIEFTFYREKIATFYNFFDSHFQKNRRFGLEIPVV